MNYEHAVQATDGTIYPMTKRAAIETVEAHPDWILLVRSVTDWREIH